MTGSAAAETCLRTLKTRLPAINYYLYDMALASGPFTERMNALGLSPATKLPRNTQGEAAHGLLEVKAMTLADGRTLDLDLYGLDGVCGVRVVDPDGEPQFVALDHQRVLARGTRRYADCRIPDHPLIHRDLRGRTILVRLDGLTSTGRWRSNYVRWINEHSPGGLDILGQRNGTESVNSVVKRALPFGRSSSVGQFNNTLDLVGFFFCRNLKAALAHERRTGVNPLRPTPP